MKVINGDPKTFESSKCHVKIDWYDRIFNDQLEVYEEWGDTNNHSNEAKGWKEYLERIRVSEEADLTLHWWTYKGKNAGENPPLIICLDEYYSRSWQYIADREGLIIVAFEYHRNYRLPNNEEGMGALGFGSKPDEIITYHEVVKRVMEEYNVDKQRVYINGLSYGDGSALNYAMRYSDTLAGIVLINGPTSPYNCKRYQFDKMPPLPSMQIRSEDDITCDGFPDGMSFDAKGNKGWLRQIRSESTIYNRNIWLRANNISSREPKILTEGTRTFLIYESEAGDVIYAEMADRCHIGAVDYAEEMWQKVYSRYKRNDRGGIEKIKELPAPDKKSIGLVVGSSRAYIDNQVTELAAPCYMVDPKFPLNRATRMYGETECSYSSFYAPVELLKKGFGIGYTVEDLPNFSVWNEGEDNDRIQLDDKVIKFSFSGKHYEIYTNTCLIIEDGITKDLVRPVLTIDGNLMVPVKEFGDFFGFYVSERNEAVYVSDHKNAIGYTVSRILREEVLADKIEEKIFPVSLIKHSHGHTEISTESIKLGDTLEIKTFPEEGYKVTEVYGIMNGLEAPVDKLKENEYIVCNVMGDLVVEVIYGE